MAKKKKLDTKLFSNGAEFLVLSKLLLSNIQAYKTYVNFEGYDLVAVNPSNNKSAKVQVKSKNQLNDSGFYLNKDSITHTDFYVFAQTYAYKRDEGEVLLINDSVASPKLWVMDYKTAEKNKRVDKLGTPWISMSKKSFPEAEKYLFNSACCIYIIFNFRPDPAVIA